MAVSQFILQIYLNYHKYYSVLALLFSIIFTELPLFLLPVGIVVVISSQYEQCPHTNQICLAPYVIFCHAAIHHQWSPPLLFLPLGPSCSSQPSSSSPVLLALSLPMPVLYELFKRTLPFVSLCEKQVPNGQCPSTA